MNDIQNLQTYFEISIDGVNNKIKLPTYFPQQCLHNIYNI